MNTPTPPQVPPNVPLTPLGARTPHAHPALYGVIAFFSLVIVAGAAWVLWPDSVVAPTAAPTPSVEAAEWKTYTNAQYGFSVKYPPSVAAGAVATNTDLGSVQNPVPGIYIGPLVFVPLTDGELKNRARESVYTDCPVQSQVTEDSIPYFCIVDLDTTIGAARIRAISVGPEGATSRAFISGGATDVYVDGGSEGYDFGKHGQLTREEYMAILSSFTFLEEPPHSPDAPGR
jgi:hypothetical protein